MKNLTCAFALWAAASSVASASSTLYGLYNTGVDSQGNLEELGTSSAYYLVNGPGFPVDPARVLPNAYQTWLPNSWLPNSAASQWISIPNGHDWGPSGDYVFTTTFKAPSSTPLGKSWVLTGGWAVDNSGYITVGGDSTQYATIAFGVSAYHQLNSFSIPIIANGLTTTIVFHVNNAKETPPGWTPHNDFGNSPVGLRAEMQLSAVPEAPTYIAGIGLLAILGFGWMFHPSRASVIKSS
jgi:hypothetical protein